MFRKLGENSEGFYDEAVISIQTSIEILIRIIYREVLICSGTSELDIEKILEDESFMSVVKKQLAKYIGGVWDITREETPIGKWYNNTYKIRNKKLFMVDISQPSMKRI